MQDPSSITTSSAQLPARAVISLPDLVIVTADTRGGDTDLDLPETLDVLFSEFGQSLIGAEIVPRLLEGDIWSGELPVPVHVDPSQDAPAGAPTETAMTMWVPHVHSDAPALHATVLIGAVITNDAKRVAPDPLTGLPSRIVLLDRLDQARRRSRRNNDLMAALFVDLDSLKSINDRLGHEAGDAALARTARLITGCLRDGDTVARFGGDEFVVLCESLETEDQANRVAERILERLADDTDELSASIGIAFDQGGELSSIELIRQADTAMYRAKARGGAKVAVFDAEMQVRIEADELARAQLVEALTAQALKMQCQPIFALGSGQIVGVEMFLRVPSDDGLVEAREVLRIGRDLSEEIDRAILTQAVDLAQTWRTAFGAASPRIHLNVSTQSLSTRRFFNLVVDSLDVAHVHPRALAFEVNSASVAPTDQRQIETLHELQRIGCSIVVDGYGTGSESLRLVHSLQPSMVKLATYDPVLDRPIQPDVVLGLMRAVNTLNIASCVTSVEDPALLDRIVTAGAYAAQGNALMPVSETSAMAALIRAANRLGF